MRESERRQRQRVAEPVGKLVGRVLDGYHLTEEIRRNRLLLSWRTLVGAKNAARTRPYALIDGVLHVRVWDSSWLHQLSFIHDQLIATINERMGDPPMVSSLRMDVGRVLPRSAPPPPTVGRRRRGGAWYAPPEPAHDADLEIIRRECAEVADPEVRQAIEDFRTRWNV